MHLPICEVLETRQLLAAQPTAYEQYVLALINRARTNPLAEARRYGLASLNEGLAAGTISSSPRQPLAISAALTQSAREHSEWMIATDQFSHSGVGEASPYDRMLQEGYAFQYPGGAVENIGWRGEYPAHPDPLKSAGSLHRQLFVDRDIEHRSHRVNLLDGDMSEIGVGFVAGAFRDSERNWNALMLTEDIASRPGDHFITGVVYADLVKRNAFYTPGEGLGGVLLTATRREDGQVYTTRTLKAGGYALRVPDGTYDVVASSGGLPGALTRPAIAVGGLNVLLDFSLRAATSRPRILAGGVLRIDGTAGNDLISVRKSGKDLLVSLNGVLSTYSASLVSSVEIWGWQGNDTISGSNLPDHIYGLWGNDVLRGNGGNDTISGGNGNDRLSGGAGADVLNGDAGNDQVLGGDGPDVLSDSGGADVLDGGGMTDAAGLNRSGVTYLSIETALA